MRPPHKHEITLPSSGITTRIALLSLLTMRPMHGYELRQVMEQRHMHRWADIGYGSIYRGLQQLAREGLLAEDGEERFGNRPPRTIYRITEAGQAELKKLLHQAWSEPVRFADPVDLAIILFHHLTPAEIAELLQQRLQALQAIESKIGRVYADIQARTQHLPPASHAVSMDMFTHRKRLLQVEIEWTQHLLNRLASGAYTLSDSDYADMQQRNQQRMPFNSEACGSDDSSPIDKI